MSYFYSKFEAFVEILMEQLAHAWWEAWFRAICNVSCKSGSGPFFDLRCPGTMRTEWHLNRFLSIESDGRVVLHRCQHFEINKEKSSGTYNIENIL